MIYELEKIELYGISWLNYFTLGLILTIISLIVSLIFVHFDLKTGDKHKYLENCVVVLFLITLVCALSTAFNFGDSGKYNSNTVPLSTISDKITVNGDKVTINKFDKPYVYQHLTHSEDEYTPKSNTDQIFKFEYNEFYETGKLITEKGGYYELSKEDARYLKEKGSK